MKKLMISFSLAAALALTLSACGDDSSKNEDSQSSVTPNPTIDENGNSTPSELDLSKEGAEGQLTEDDFRAIMMILNDHQLTVNLNDGTTDEEGYKILEAEGYSKEDFSEWVKMLSVGADGQVLN